MEARFRLASGPGGSGGSIANTTMAGDIPLQRRAHQERQRLLAVELATRLETGLSSDAVEAILELLRLGVRPAAIVAIVTQGG